MPAERAISGGQDRGVLRSARADDTLALGRRLASAVDAGDVITLSGPFGAGKTTFVQGLGAGLGIRGPLTSPSFAIAHEYRPLDTGARLPMVHLDLYRLRDSSEAADAGLEDYLLGDAVVVVEWPEPAAELLPQDRLSLEIGFDDEARVLRASAGGARSAALLRHLVSEVAR